MRIAIVNDMMLAVEALRRALVADGRHTVAWVARDGAEAVEKCEADTPDLILMDLIMPMMDGVEATRRIMASNPCAILVVTATVEGNATRVYEALGAGAVDAVETPALGKSIGMLMVKLDLIERRLQSSRRDDPPLMPAVGVTREPADVRTEFLVAIGASAGGPAALATLLAGVPAGFGGTIVIVQHIDAAFVPGLITWLGQTSALPVCEAIDGDAPRSGRVYVAGGDSHLTISATGHWKYSAEPRECAYQPSIDVFFESMVRNWRRAGAGVLLTGMGRDGARGLLSLRQAGFVTLTQDRETSAVYGMPKAAADLGAAVHVLPLEFIASRLSQLLFAAGAPGRPANAS